MTRGTLWEEIAQQRTTVFVGKRIIWGCPGVPVHEGIPFVFITIHGVMTQFVNVSFFCVPVHEDTTDNLFVYYEVKVLADKFTYGLQTVY